MTLEGTTTATLYPNIAGNAITDVRRLVRHFRDWYSSAAIRVTEVVH
jgi:hypothetical protein